MFRDCLPENFLAGCFGAGFGGGGGACCCWRAGGREEPRSFCRLVLGRLLWHVAQARSFNIRADLMEKQAADAKKTDKEQEMSAQRSVRKEKSRKEKSSSKLDAKLMV